MTEEHITSAASAVARLLYGEIGEDHPSWDSCVEIARTALGVTLAPCGCALQAFAERVAATDKKDEGLDGDADATLDALIDAGRDALLAHLERQHFSAPRP
jgi:hypothetical protein